MTATDSFGNAAAPTKSIAVSVTPASGALTISAPAATTVGVGQSNPVGAISLAESPTTTGETFTAVLTDSSGVLAANTGAAGGGGSVVASGGGKALTISGTLAQVNADLTTLTDTNATTASDTISVNATDSLGGSAGPSLIVVTVNGGPVLASPGAQTIGVNKTASLGTIGLSETGNSGAPETFKVTLSDTTGVLSATAAAGLTISGTATNLILSGGLSVVQAALATITDTNATAVTDNITVNAMDSFGNAAAAQTVAVTVNGTPSIAAPASATVAQGVSTAVSGVSVSETGNTTTSGETFTAVVTDTAGALSASGTGVSGSGSHSLTISGSLAQVNADLTTLASLEAGTTADTITVTATDSFGNAASPTTSIGVSVTPSSATFTLTRGPDTVAGGGGNDTVIAGTNTLSSGDLIDGGGGTNTLALVGAGLFNLKAPTTLSNIQIVTAQEGQQLFVSGASVIAAQNQIVYLRDNLDVTLNAVAATLNGANPRAATLTVVGAHNAAVINLASGNDQVLVGDARETVHGGTGNNTILVSGATIGATIDGGTGHTTLDVTGGGSVTMGSTVTNITTVLLASAPGNLSFIANAQAGLTVVDQSHGANTITAGGSGQTLSGGFGTDTFNAAAAGGNTFKNLAAVFNGDTIGGLASGGNTISITDLDRGASGFVLSFVENLSNTAGTLSVTDGTHSTVLTLNGSFLATSFHSTLLGLHGTSITLSLPAV